VRQLFLIFLGVVAVSSSSHGQLAWETTRRELRARPGDPSVETAFPFKNTGDVPVRIVRVTSSCGCTVAKPTRELIPPGAGGEVTAIFQIGYRTGLQQKTITVETEPAATVRLAMLTLIEPDIQVEPSVLVWKAGEPPAERIVRVRVFREVPIAALRVESGPGFQSTIRELRTGREYEVVFKPAATVSPMRSEACLVAETAGEQPQKIQVRLRIK